MSTLNKLIVYRDITQSIINYKLTSENGKRVFQLMASCQILDQK